MQKRRVGGQLQWSESKHSGEPHLKLPFMLMARTITRKVDKAYEGIIGSLSEPCSLPIKGIILEELLGSIARLLRWLIPRVKD